jgi:uncharacterized peroxidase-related enzyme
MTTPEYELLSKLTRPSVGVVRTNLPVVEESEASGETAEAYQYFRANFGRPEVPGILKCFSSSPAMLRNIMQMASTLIFSEGFLGRRMKEMISTYVSFLNACPYCLDSHGFSLLVHGGNEAVLRALSTGHINDDSITVPERYLLAFVRKVTLESHQVDQADIVDLRASGWEEQQIAECIHVTAMFASFNRVANAFGLPSQDLLGLISNSKEEKSDR